MFPRTVSQLRFPLSIYSKFLSFAIFLYNRVQRRTQKLQYTTGFLKMADLKMWRLFLFYPPLRTSIIRQFCAWSCYLGYLISAISLPDIMLRSRPLTDRYKDYYHVQIFNVGSLKHNFIWMFDNRWKKTSTILINGKCAYIYLYPAR